MLPLRLSPTVEDPSSPAWRILEHFDRQSALLPDWLSHIGPLLEPLKSLCLQPSPITVGGWRCPLHCGCTHTVLSRHDRTGAVAICRCSPANCPDIPLATEQITPWELSWPRLGRAICNALILNPKFVRLNIGNTRQIGSWSTGAVPAILTIQTSPGEFLSAVARLAATHRQPFILFAPTAGHLDALGNQMLLDVGAGFFPLESIVTLTDSGVLLAKRPPGEFFAQFTPDPDPDEREKAVQIMGIVSRLDDEPSLKHLSLISVFRLYTIQGLSASRVAKELETSKPTIIRRLTILTARLGAHPERLRRYSPYLAEIDQRLCDDRAKSIDRHHAIYGVETDY